MQCLIPFHKYLFTLNVLSESFVSLRLSTWELEAAMMRKILSVTLEKGKGSKVMRRKDQNFVVFTSKCTSATIDGSSRFSREIIYSTISNFLLSRKCIFADKERRSKMSKLMLPILKDSKIKSNFNVRLLLFLLFIELCSTYSHNFVLKSFRAFTVEWEIK